MKNISPASLRFLISFTRCAYSTTLRREVIRFLDMAYGSVKEVEYQLTIAARLNFADETSVEKVSAQATETSKVLHGLIRSLRKDS